MNTDPLPWRGNPAEILCADDPDAVARRRLVHALAAMLPAWHADAACRDVERVTWFPTRSESTALAIQLCLGCPVRGDCLAEALADESLDFGIRAALTVPARQALRKRVAA